MPQSRHPTKGQGSWYTYLLTPISHWGLPPSSAISHHFQRITWVGRGSGGRASSEVKTTVGKCAPTQRIGHSSDSVTYTILSMGFIAQQESYAEKIAHGNYGVGVFFFFNKVMVLVCFFFSLPLVPTLKAHCIISLEHFFSDSSLFPITYQSMWTPGSTFYRWNICPKMWWDFKTGDQFSVKFNNYPFKM